MNASPIAVAALALGLVLAAPIAAHADPPADDTESVIYGEIVGTIDTTTCTITNEYVVWVREVPTDPWVESLREFVDTAQGTETDCPNWQQDEDTWEWSNTDQPAPANPDHPDKPRKPEKADDGVVWKVGLAVPPKVL